MVEGQLRCFLSIKLDDLDWSIPRPPKDIQVRILWWGQSGNGAVLRPQVKTDPTYLASKNKHAEVHYPVRCGPRQFESYLKDMNGLHLNVIFGPSCTSFADVNIVDIGQFSSTQILESYYPLICSTPAFQGKEVGQLKVTISFKSISDTYNVSSSIIPTTDKEFHQPPLAKNKNKVKVTDQEKEKDISKVKKGKAKVEDRYKDKDPRKNVQMENQLPKAVPIKNKKVVKISSKPSTMKHTYEDVNKDVSFVVGPGASRFINNEEDRLEVMTSTTKSDEDDSDVDIAEPFITRANNRENVVAEKDDSGVISQQPVVLKGEQRATILGSLLDKTQNLRNNMIRHTLESDNVPVDSQRKSDSKSSSVFLKELLGNENLSNMSHDDAKLMLENNMETDNCSASQELDKLDMRVVDLLFGKDDNIEHLLKRVDMSVDSNFSICSEDQDPLHDSSLLDVLLYTTRAAQNVDESSIISLDGNSKEDLNIREANKNMKLNKLITDNHCDLIPTKLDPVCAGEVAEDEDESFVTENNSNKMSTPKSSESSRSTDSKPVPESITIENLTQLGRVKSAKVILKEFSLSVQDMDYGLVYFVEFKFPVSTDENQGVSMENIRNVSRHVNDVVEFGRFSVFPIMFNEDMVEFWWQNYIAFRIYVKYERQGKGEWLGEGYFKLRDVLLSEEFKKNADVDIYDDTRVHSGGHKGFSSIGQLKVYFELTTEHGKSISSKSSKVGSLPPLPTAPSEKKEKAEISSPQLTPIKINTKFTKTQPPSEIKMDEKKDFAQPKEKLVSPNTFLHNLIVVSDGRDIINSTKDSNEVNHCNSYFVCRVFWSNGELKSKICWSTNNPIYSFQQIIPVTLSESTIGKMANNFMIIEVWHKSTTTNRDKLIGMSKLSLHQFFLSFKDPKLAETILKSKFPVIAHDGAVPVVNLLSGDEYGSLNILFALGTHDQVMEILQMKKVLLPHPSHHDKGKQSGKLTDNDTIHVDDGTVNHCFEVTIENVKDFNQGTDEIWGEADCYVQYHFPDQDGVEMKMAGFKTRTTLCLPNPVFNHSTTHSFNMDKNVPLHKLFLECFKGTSHDVRFELWKRHYYPNVRDQLVSKASLPLSKLCAMMTMDSRCGDGSQQAFHLPLEHEVNGNKNTDGVLGVTMGYKLRSSEGINSAPKQLVCLSVSVNRLCGSKDALSWLSKKSKKLSHACRSGPNIYVRIHVSFMGKSSLRTTNVAAKNFSPTFNYHIDFPLPMTFGSEGKTSLAEMLEDGLIVCEVMHEFAEGNEEDVMIGVVRIPLVNVLTHATGIKGWWLLKIPDSDDETNAGGIEVNAKFANNTDREQVVNNGRGMGWSSSSDLGLHSEAWFTTTTNESECECSALNLYLDVVVLPRNVLDDILCKYVNVKHRFGTMYCRYKFYNKAPIYSKSAKVRLDGSMYTCSLSHSSSHEVIPNSSFAWYLREEKLEIQFWLSWCNYTAMDTSFTRQKDKLVGSVYVDMSSFAHSPYSQKVISGQHSLFNSNCDSICNATARVSMSFNTNLSHEEREDLMSQHLVPNSPDDSYNSTNDEENILNDICKKKSRVTQHEVSGDEGDNEDSEKVGIHIEEAMHLPLLPNVYVTYQLPKGRLVYTHSSEGKGRHKWNFQKQHKMKLVVLKGKRLVYHVWRCCREKQDIEQDVLIGIVEVDTEPLFVGLKQILGWYNIHDLNRQVVGQIKLGIVPSDVASLPMSNKYFRNKLPFKPVTLSGNRYPAQTPSVLPEVEALESLPKGSLFEKLNMQLNELQELTSRIQHRVYSTSEPPPASPPVTSQYSTETILPRVPIGNERTNAVPVVAVEIDTNNDETSNDKLRDEMFHKNTDYGERVGGENFQNRINDGERVGDNFHNYINDGERVGGNFQNYINDGERVGDNFQNDINEGKRVVNDPPSHASPNSLVEEDLNANAKHLGENVTVPSSTECHGSEHDGQGNVNFDERHDETNCREEQATADDDNSLFDGADDLLDDLKMFERKFSSIKNTIENDFEQDSWLSDTEVVDVNLCHGEPTNRIKRPRTRSPPDGKHIHLDAIITPDRGTLDIFSPIETIDRPGDRDTCLVERNCDERISDIEEEAGSPLEEGVEKREGGIDFQICHCDEGGTTAVHTDASSDDRPTQAHTTVIHSCENADTSDNPKLTSDPDHFARGIGEYSGNPSNGFKVLDVTSDEELATSSSDATPSEYHRNSESGIRVGIPNFFMQPDELAESMQALRLAAKLRESPRRNDFRDDDNTRVKTVGQPKTDAVRNDDKQVKEKIRHGLPVEASEMARIASIFSLKSQGK